MTKFPRLMLIFAPALLLAVLIACAPRSTSAPAGQALFAHNCATCHGADARGGAQIPDLTGLSLRADGTFPRLHVLDKLDGYARGEAVYGGTQMPDFGHLLTGTLTRVETRSGVSRAYPEAVVALTAWLEQAQR